MAPGAVLRMAGKHYDELKRALFPGDGKEAAAILFCRDAGLARDVLLVVDVAAAPIEACAERSDIRLTWPGETLAVAQSRAEDDGLGLILIHSHPGGFKGFSGIDDESDRTVMKAIYAGWLGDAEAPRCGSAIMTSDGFMLARLYDASLHATFVDCIEVQGDDIIRFRQDRANVAGDVRPPMAFSPEMDDEVRSIHAAVVGVSGTGSIVAEQLARMGVGCLTLIDFDKVEQKNLNRIVNSTTADAEAGSAKVEMMADAIARYAPQVETDVIARTVFSRRAILAAAACDIVFCCVDSQEGRQICDLIAQAFIIPLIDIGVSLPTRRGVDGALHIADVLARVDYVQPGGAMLEDRGVYSPQGLRAEYLARVAPEDYRDELNAGYVKGAVIEAPPVMSVNMRAASAAVLEFIARLAPFRHESNRRFARTIFRMAEGEEEFVGEDAFDVSSREIFGRGAAAPLLLTPALEEAE